MEEQRQCEIRHVRHAARQLASPASDAPSPAGIHAAGPEGEAFCQYLPGEGGRREGGGRLACLMGCVCERGKARALRKTYITPQLTLPNGPSRCDIIVTFAKGGDLR